MADIDYDSFPESGKVRVTLFVEECVRDELKRQCDCLGMTMSGYITMLLTQNRDIGVCSFAGGVRDGILGQGQSDCR